MRLRAVSLVVTVIVYNLVLATALMWLLTSFASSAVKTVNNDCGVSYKIDRLIWGDMFCGG